MKPTRIIDKSTEDNSVNNIPSSILNDRQILDKVKKLINEVPNDYTLGLKIRELFNTL